MICTVCGQRQHTDWCEQVSAVLQKQETKRVEQRFKRGPGRPRKFEEDPRPMYGPPRPPGRELVKARAAQKRQRKAVLYLEQYLQDRTLDDVGRIHGVTRERVRQVIEESYPGRIAEETQRRRAANKEQRKRERAELMVEHPECLVCLKPFRGHKFRSVCDDRRCYVLSKHARWLVDPKAHERQRLAISKYAVAHPDKNQGGQLQVESAQRLLDYYAEHGFMPPPNRMYEANGKFAAMLTELGGEDLIREHWRRRAAYYEGRPLLGDRVYYDNFLIEDDVSSSVEP